MNFIIILFFIVAGWLAKDKQWLNKSLSQKLNQYVINICIPAIVFLNIPKLELTIDLLLVAIIPWILLAFLSVIIINLGKYFKWSAEVVGCILLFACFGNTSFLGYPIIEAFYGSENVKYAMIYDQFGSFLSLAIIANIIVIRYSNSEFETVGKNSTISMFKTIVKFPPFIALIIAIFLPNNLLNEMVLTGLNLIALTLVPATMLLVGFYFDLHIPAHFRQPLMFGLVAKLIIAPLLCAVILVSYYQSDFFVKSNLFLFKVTLMESAMPPMVTTTIMAIHAKLAPKLAVAAVGYGLLVSAFTLPIIYLVNHSLFS